MFAYLLRRLLFVIPTLWVIMTINFFVIQIAPGGPVEQALTRLEQGGDYSSLTSQLNAEQSLSQADTRTYQGTRGLDPELIAAIEKQYGFDKPIWQRYLETMRQYICFDFGHSLFKSDSVVQLILNSLPVSLSLGLWSTLLIYLISIPLGIRKALKAGSRFDLWSSLIIIIGYAIPAFLLAILLIILFAGGSYWDLFPLRGLTSSNFAELNWWQQLKDYFWHLTLPTIAMIVGGFAMLTMLTKNCFLDEIRKQYVLTARAKGLNEQQILYRHIFRNASLLIVSGFPAAFIGMFFTGSLLIEIIFSLHGLGLLGYEAILQRDYPVIFGTLYIFTLIGLITNIISDLTYMIIDPRIDFEAR